MERGQRRIRRRRSVTPEDLFKKMFVSCFYKIKNMFKWKQKEKLILEEESIKV